MSKIYKKSVTRAFMQAEADYMKAGNMKKARQCYEALWEYVDHASAGLPADKQCHYPLNLS